VERRIPLWHLSVRETCISRPGPFPYSIALEKSKILKLVKRGSAGLSKWLRDAFSKRCRFEFERFFRDGPPRKKKIAESLCLYYIAIESCGSLTWLNGLSYVLYITSTRDSREIDRVYDNYTEFDALVYSVIILAAIFLFRLIYILAGYSNSSFIPSLYCGLFRLKVPLNEWKVIFLNHQQFKWEKYNKGKSSM
jgi:hypothetical protein